MDEIITMLGQVPELAIAGRNSSFGLNGSERSLTEIAHILGVSYLLEGSVQQQGSDVRINVSLIDGNTGFEKWGKPYSGNVDDVFTLQERVAKDITKELSAVLNIELKKPRSSPLTTNIQAYGFYVQGRSLLKRRFGDGIIEQAVSTLEHALVLDPEFAEAWTALAEANAYLVFSVTDDNNTSVLSKKIAACAEEAMRLSKKQGYAMVLLGYTSGCRRTPLQHLI